MPTSRSAPWSGRFRIRRPRREVRSSAILPECTEDAVALALVLDSAHVTLACG